MSDGERVLRRRSSVDAAELDGEVLLFDGMFLRRLDPAGALIWSLVDGHRSSAQIAAAVSAGQPPEVVGRVTDDVLAFLGDLLGHRVLELAMLDRTTFRRPTEVGWARDEESVLLVDVRDGRRRALTPTASLVWELVCEDGSAEGAIEVLREAYPDAPSMPGDVEALLTELVREGWLVRHEAVRDSAAPSP